MLATYHRWKSKGFRQAAVWCKQPGRRPARRMSPTRHPLPHGSLTVEPGPQGLHQTTGSGYCTGPYAQAMEVSDRAQQCCCSSLACSLVCTAHQTASSSDCGPVGAGRGRSTGAASTAWLASWPCSAFPRCSAACELRSASGSPSSARLLRRKRSMSSGSLGSGTANISSSPARTSCLPAAQAQASRAGARCETRGCVPCCA